MKISGVVMEKTEKEHEVIIFTQNGEFLNVPAYREDIKPGEVIEVDSEDRRNTGKSKRKYMKGLLMPAAAVLILSLFMSVYFSFFSNPASAYVALDFNPSVELEVDEKSRVIDYHWYNDDGKKLLKEIKIKDMKVYEAIDEIVKRAIELDYIYSDEENLIMASVVPAGEEETIDEEKIKSLITEYMQRKKLKGYVSVNKSSEDIREEAIQKGLSINRYMVLKHLPDRKEEYNSNEINNSNMMEMIDHEDNMFERHNYMNMDNGHDRGNMNSGHQGESRHGDIPENNMHDKGKNNTGENSNENNMGDGMMEEYEKHTGGTVDEYMENSRKEHEMHDERLNYHQEKEAMHREMENKM